MDVTEVGVEMIPAPSENLLVLSEINDPIPLTHPLNVLVARFANSDAAAQGEFICGDGDCIAGEFFIEFLIDTYVGPVPYFHNACLLNTRPTVLEVRGSSCIKNVWSSMEHPR